MNHGSLWERLVRGVRWSWIDERYRSALPADFDAMVMTLESRDRLHAKQGRSTARVVFHPPDQNQSGGRPLSVYLKRHFQMPWLARFSALVHPNGRYSPGAAEWAHLERARSLGVPVPDVVAIGERIGPWAGLQSYLVVAELTGCKELNEALPVIEQSMDREAFESLKRRIVKEMARISATIHKARMFHKDLYLCHFFLDLERLARDPRDVALTLIDLHRLQEHRYWPDRWRWKDLGQLLFSTEGVAGVSPRDALRFWVHYKREAGVRNPEWQARMIRLKAARYSDHNAASEPGAAERLSEPVGSAD
ncbi:lipopolysaccharide kinase InaA family protein [Paludisphaera borealis]|uniref:Lipopolysaccharide core heptose(I) kinase RfaP n=1 Tax=Paludisphaera borealis TaxID=1387353 RepID=A0A1U7CW39_9BACT|nr:lipopolysaccharide kinase InaA family protein [Paludisphaera borealis]APW63141.1 Lipopolysaccharide core heptose(I) kinase RfaP [Paludisphaera borealis]